VLRVRRKFKVMSQIMDDRIWLEGLVCNRDR
jgi:hypothetical protein